MGLFHACNFMWVQCMLQELETSQIDSTDNIYHPHYLADIIITIIIIIIKVR